ncbi:MAG: hypothetical protein MUC89_08670 [Acetobacteraceae bacterium]|nr:hypothetical protein [Acetobacteraceae bacterium]
MRLAIAALLLVLTAAPAAAQPLRDTASGIGITAPQGFVATPIPTPATPGPGRAVFDVKAPGDTDTGCRVAVNNAPSNALLSQQELNTRAASPEYIQAMAGQLSTVYNLLGINPVGLGTVLGLGAIPRPGLAARAAELRIQLVGLDTPIQRVTRTCIAAKRAFDDRLPGFEAVLQGLDIPTF